VCVIPLQHFTFERTFVHGFPRVLYCSVSVFSFSKLLYSKVKTFCSHFMLNCKVIPNLPELVVRVES